MEHDPADGQLAYDLDRAHVFDAGFGLNGTPARNNPLNSANIW